MELRYYMLLSLIHFCLQVVAEQYTLVKQSSTKNSYFASLAVDNNITSCSATEFGKNNMWEMHLPGLARITNVTIYNADGVMGLYLSGFKVLVSNSTKEKYTVCAHGPVLTNAGQIYNLECLANARILQIKLSSARRQLILCEVKVHGYWIKKDELLSHGKKAEQSSTYFSEGHKFIAEARFAVDGKTNQVWAYKSCSCTEESTNPWWQVDLVGLARVTMVTVYNRGDEHGERLSGFHVFVSNNTHTYKTTCAVGPGKTTNGQIIKLMCDSVTRNVGIKLYSNNKKIYLTLCEVKVYGYWIEQDELLSKNMPATQSSTFKMLYAVNTIAYDHVFSCTSKGIRPWWQVHLSGVALVTYLSICSTHFCVGKELIQFNVLVTEGKNFTKCASGPETPTTEPAINLKCYMNAKIVRISTLGTKKRMLCLFDTKIFGHWSEKGELLSVGMPTHQTFTYYDMWRFFYAVSGLAVDGITKQRWKDKSCSCTNKLGRGFWYVELPGEAKVYMVTIYSAYSDENQLSEFFIEVGSTICTYYGKNNIIKDGAIVSLECEGVTRYVRIRNKSIKKERYLVLCEVQVYGTMIRGDELVSLGGTARQSSTYYAKRTDFRFDANYALDGDPDSCSSTRNYGYHWWEVYLKGLARVTIVSIYPAYNNRLTKFVVKTTDTTERNFKVCAEMKHKMKTEGGIVGMNCQATARIVQILLKKYTNYLHSMNLCEVKVYGQWIGV